METLMNTEELMSALCAAAIHYKKFAKAVEGHNPELAAHHVAMAEKCEDVLSAVHKRRLALEVEE